MLGKITNQGGGKRKVRTVQLLAEDVGLGVFFKKMNKAKLCQRKTMKSSMVITAGILREIQWK